MSTFDIVGGTDDDAAQAYGRVAGEESGPVQVKASSLPIHFGGAGPTTIPSLATATFTFNLNMALRPDRLVLPSAIAATVCVVSINIGAISLNASSDPAPGDMFQHDSTSALRGAVSGSPSVPVKVTVLNKTSTAIEAVYLGLSGPSKRVN